MAQVNKVHSVRTLALVARDLGTHEDWLIELANGMDWKDGLIWVCGIDFEDSTMPFTDIGVENLAPSSPTRDHLGAPTRQLLIACGPQRIDKETHMHPN